MNSLFNLIKKNRSYRRFDESSRIEHNVVLELINMTRYTASARNSQPLLYLPVTEEGECSKVFSCLAWAGYLKDWKGPKEGERPTGYIIMLKAKSHTASTEIDEGICMQTILLAAVEKGFGGCILGAVDRDLLQKNLEISPEFSILDVIALGKPKETVEIVDMVDNDFKYYRDANGVHYVPKRSLNDIVLKK